MGLKAKTDNLSALQRESLPQNLEAEKALLSAILINNRTLPEVLEILQPQHFYRDAHVEIFNAMVTLFNRREPIDLVTVHNVLKDSGKLASCGGAAYISKLVDAVPAAINPKMYAWIVHEKSVVRGLIYKSNDIINQCFQAYEDVDALIDFADSALFEIYNRRIRSVFTSVGNLIPGNVSKIESWYKDKSLVRGLPTGFKDFDRLTHGLQDSDLIILAARPSMGKTTMALNMARNVAVDFGAPVAVFSLEISEISRSLKSLAKELKVPVIALSQLNRELEKRKNKRPQLSDLRESGSLEQDADLVVFIYREEVYEEIPGAAARGRAEIILAKHRNGPTDSVRLAFLKQYTRFENLAPQQ